MAEKILEWIFLHLIPWIILGLLVGILIIIPFCFFLAPKSQKFSLDKNDWSCTKFYEYTTTSYLLAGKVMVPRTVTNKDCIQWTRK